MTKTITNTMVQDAASIATGTVASAAIRPQSILRGRFGSTSVEKQGSSVFAAAESLGMVGTAQAADGLADTAQAFNLDPTPPVYARTTIRRT